jgi:hypothetical protein
LVQIWDTYQNDYTPFQPIELHDFLKREELERSWLIAGYIPAGTVIGLIAGGGSGKTLLTYDLIKAIATGQSWNGFRASQTKVLIVQTDEQFLDTKERLEIANYQEGIAIFITNERTFGNIKTLSDRSHFKNSAERIPKVIANSKTKIGSCGGIHFANKNQLPLSYLIKVEREIPKLATNWHRKTL